MVQEERLEMAKMEEEEEDERSKEKHIDEGRPSGGIVSC